MSEAPTNIRPAEAGSALFNTGWLVGDRVLRGAIGLFVGVWVARYLGPHNFGVLAYATAFASLFAWLADLGLDRLVIREILAGRFDAASVAGTAFLLKLAGGASVLILATATAFTLNPDPVTTILVALAAAGTIAQAVDVVDYRFQSLLQSKYVVLARAISFYLTALAKLVLIWVQAPLLAFGVAGLVELVLAAVLLVLVHRAKAPLERRWQWNAALARLFFRDGWPLAFSSLMIMMYMRIDQVMLERLAGADELGKYAASVRLAESWFFVLNAISTSIYPRLVDSQSSGNTQAMSMVRRYYSAMILVAYAFALPLSLFSTFLSKGLFGPEFDGMAAMLAVGVWSGVFVGMALVRGAYCTAKNLNRFLLCSTSVGAALNVILNLLLMPRYGGRGAALATLISYAVAGCGTSFFYGPTREQGKMAAGLLLPWNAWRQLNWRAVADSLRIG